MQNANLCELTLSWQNLVSSVSSQRLGLSQFQLLQSVLPDRLLREWKLISVMIGPNDLCNFCPSSGGPNDGASGSQYLEEMRNVLAAFSASLDYALVHVVAPFNVSLVSSFSDVQCVLAGVVQGVPKCTISVDICAQARSFACPCLAE